MELFNKRMQTWASWVLKGIGGTIPSAEGMCRGEGSTEEQRVQRGIKVMCKSGPVSTLAWLSPVPDQLTLSGLIEYFLNCLSQLSLSLQYVHVLQGLTASYRWHPTGEWNFVLASGVRLGGCWASEPFQNCLCAARGEDVPMSVCVQVVCSDPLLVEPANRKRQLGQEGILDWGSWRRQILLVSLNTKGHMYIYIYIYMYKIL